MARPRALLVPAYHAGGIGWALHRQGRGYLESGYYREVEAPLDSCWILDTMISNGSPSRAGLYLTRPCGARPFSVEDVHRLDRLRPSIAVV